MENTYTMTPLSVIINKLRQRGVRITHCSQLQRFCIAQWEQDKKKSVVKEKQVFVGMEDWADPNEVQEENDSFEIATRR